MRRRLTLSILVLLAVTLVATSAGSYFLIRRAALSTTQTELSGQARAISATIAGGAVTKAGIRRELKVISEAGAFTGIALVALQSDGAVTGTLPTGVELGPVALDRLVHGAQVSGHTGSLLVYSALPTSVAKLTGAIPVLVVTRQAHDPANGLQYFALVGAIVLAVAALVAAALARRLTRPILAAAATTRRIAAGDLDATVPIRPGEDPELAQLALSINAMGANLVRARDQERQFILSVSHELRTPLTSIRGYADAVIDGAATDATAAAMVISGEATRLERLVQDLLDLARIDADRFSLDIRVLDGSRVVGQVADGFVPRAHELGLELVVSTEREEPLWVEADPDRLGQIVANLLENASTYAERRVEVGRGTVVGRPVVWVVDDGPGIPSGQLSRVFERHFTSDTLPVRSGSGTKGSGLGLAIVAELAAAMGATVRAESPVLHGRGTRMTVWLAGAADPGSPAGSAPLGPGGTVGAAGPGTADA